MQYATICNALPAVSRLSLGSWHTFVRLSREDNAALLGIALDRGVNFFDVGRYSDQPGTERTFADALRDLGVARSSYVLASKPAFAEYPSKPMAALLKESLTSLRTDYADLIMVLPPPPGIDVCQYSEEIAALVAQGLARAWGATNWSASALALAHRALIGKGGEPPSMTQQKYNIGRRRVESDDFSECLSSTGVKLCASQVLEGGLLAGRPNRGALLAGSHKPQIGDENRILPRDEGGVREKLVERYARLAEAARDLGFTPAQASIAFALANSRVSTALLGVTRPADLNENLATIELPHAAVHAALEAAWNS